MQVQSLLFELQMMYSTVDNSLNNVVPINCSNLSAFGSKQAELGADILNCCLYLKKKIQNNTFTDKDYACYLEMKPYYHAFISGSF